MQVFMCIPDFKRLRNASHIYACWHPKSKIYGYGRNVNLWHFHGRNVDAEMSVAKMSEHRVSVLIVPLYLLILLFIKSDEGFMLILLFI